MSYVTSVFSLGIAVVFGAAFIGHVRRPGEITAALADQRILSSKGADSIAFSVVVAEGLIAFTILGGLLTSKRWLLAALIVATTLLIGFLAYLIILFRTGFRGDCGCGLDEVTVSKAVIIRGSTFLVASLTALLTVSIWPTAINVVVGLAGASLGLLLIHGPSGWVVAERRMSELIAEHTSPLEPKALGAGGQ